jgi:putative membrane protein
MSQPLLATALQGITIWLWHVPVLFMSALQSELIHGLQHSSFLITALLFWWVIIDPVPRHHRVRTDIAILMLFVSGSVGDLIALYLIFAPDVVYPFYLVNETIWGMSQYADQRVGGLIMLVVGTTVYFGATFILIARNYGNTEHMHSRDIPQARHVTDPA